MTSLARSVSVRKPSGLMRADVAGAQPAVVELRPGRRPRSRTPVIHGPRTSSSPTATRRRRRDLGAVRADEPRLRRRPTSRPWRDPVAPRPPRPRRRRAAGRPSRAATSRSCPRRGRCGRRAAPRSACISDRRAGRAADDRPPAATTCRAACASRCGEQLGPDGRDGAGERRALGSRSSSASGSACRKRSGISSDAPNMQRGVRQTPRHRVEHAARWRAPCRPGVRLERVAHADLHRVQVDRAVAVRDALGVAGGAAGVAHARRRRARRPRASRSAPAGRRAGRRSACTARRGASRAPTGRAGPVDHDVLDRRRAGAAPWRAAAAPSRRR